MPLNETLTLEAVQNAMRILEENDVAVKDWDGRYYCYEWEARRLLAGGVNPGCLVILPSKVPTEK